MFTLISNHGLLGPESVAETFWKPLLNAFGKLQRRDDIMLAGRHKDGSVWVCTMGHLVGLFDKPWLKIPPTGMLMADKIMSFNISTGWSIWLDSRVGLTLI